MSITREALQSDAGMEFVFADLEVPREEFAVEPTPRARGLALRELTLHHTHDGVLGRFWHFVTQSKDKDEIFFVSTALDGSGMKPFVWPPDPSVADTAVIRLAAGQTHRWTLGEGAPVFPPQVIEGALAT